MTDTRPLGALLPQLYERQRQSTPEPDVEEILAHLDGELSDDEAEALQERLSFHPEATRRLLDLADPSRLEETDDEELPLPDPAELERLLREEGLFEPKAPVIPIRQGVHPMYRWATAALILLSVGLGIQLGQRGTTGEPNVAIWELVPRTESGERGRSDTVTAESGFSHDLLLYSNDVLADAAYRIKILDSTGELVLTRSVRTLRAGRVIFRLSAGDLSPGRYEIELASDEDPDTPLAVYPLEWATP